MASYCEQCGKGKQHLMNVSHAKNRSHKISKPNLHAFRMFTNGVSVKIYLCTKCLRMVKEGIKNQLEAVKKKTESKQMEILEKVKKKRDEKMKKKEAIQKVRKAKAIAKKELKKVATEKKNKK